MDFKFGRKNFIDFIIFDKNMVQSSKKYFNRLTPYGHCAIMADGMKLKILI